jgi:hypothetical protein
LSPRDRKLPAGEIFAESAKTKVPVSVPATLLEPFPQQSTLLGPRTHT